MESKESGKKKKAVARTHEKEVEDLTKKHPHDSTTTAAKKALGVMDEIATCSPHTTNCDSRSSSSTSRVLALISSHSTSSTIYDIDNKDSEDGCEIRNVRAALSRNTTRTFTAAKVKPFEPMHQLVQGNGRLSLPLFEG